MGLLHYVKVFINDCIKDKSIQSINDYRRTKKWLIKTILLYAVFTLIAIIATVLIFITPSFLKFIEIPLEVAYIAIPFIVILTCWGYATLFMYLPQVLSSVGKSAIKGFEIGDSIKTNHVSATHEYGNRYRVSSYTESNGCLFAFFGGLIGFFVWAVFCVYIGPFINFKKITMSIKNMKNFSSKKIN